MRLAFIITMLVFWVFVWADYLIGMMRHGKKKSDMVIVTLMGLIIAFGALAIAFP